MSHLPMSRQGMACLPAGVHRPRASGLPAFSCALFAVSLPQQGGFGFGAGRRVDIYPRDGAWAAALIAVSGSWGLPPGPAWCLQGGQASVRRERPARPSLRVAGSSVLWPALWAAGTACRPPGSGSGLTARV